MKTTSFTLPFLGILLISATTFTGCEIVEPVEQGPGPVIPTHHHHDRNHFELSATHDKTLNHAIFTVSGDKHIDRVWLFCKYPGSDGMMRIPMHRLSTAEFRAVIPHRRAHAGEWHYHVAVEADGRQHRIPEDGNRSMYVAPK